MPEPMPPAMPPDERPRYGCIIALLAVAGFFAGGMIAVAIGKVVGKLQGCTPDPGLPACNHTTYLLVGALFGLITLPAIAIWRARRGAAASNRTNRS
ncbi:MAG TPA: hypothetical protein VK922_08310 [Gemmatimonadaceae bacterium]|nr:hypothetical protein [Gemmatimonadaceae bacterium]